MIYGDFHKIFYSFRLVKFWFLAMSRFQAMTRYFMEMLPIIMNFCPLPVWLFKEWLTSLNKSAVRYGTFNLTMV